MFPAVMSNLTSVSQEGTSSSVIRVSDFASLISPMSQSSISTDQQPQQIKKKRNPRGNPDPDAEVVALSHEALLAKNQFICEVCNKGFYRDQNLQLHRREHNLPLNLKQRDDKQFKKKVYVCPVPTCIHHETSRALSDFISIKKHYTRKHGEKMWQCDKCPKIYALKSDWKTHSKFCGAKSYKCDCGIVFSRENDLISHKALCDASTAEDRLTAATTNPSDNTTTLPTFHFNNQILLPLWIPPPQNPNPNYPITLPFEDLPEY